MKPERLYSFEPDDLTKVEGQFKALYRSTFQFVLENKGSMAEARDTYVKAFTYYMQLIELRGMAVADRAEAVIYSFSRKLWLQKLEKRRVDLDFVKHRREYFEMEDAFHEIDFINTRSAKTAEKLAEIGEPGRTLVLECVGRKRSIPEVAPRLGLTDEDRAFAKLVQCFRKLIKFTEGKEFDLSDEVFARFVRYVLDGMEESCTVAEEEKVCLTMVSRVAAMVRNHIVRAERIEAFKGMEDKLTATADVITESAAGPNTTKKILMKTAGIAGLALIAAGAVSALTAFSVTEAVHKQHELQARQEAEREAFKADSLAAAAVAAEKAVPVRVSAFALTQGYALTAAKPLGDRKTVRLEAEDGGSGYRARVIKSDHNADLALLKIDEADGIEPDVPYRLAAGGAEIGEAVFSLGFPADFLAYSDGSVNAAGHAGNFRVKLSSATFGAPVIGKFGQIAGMLLTEAEDESGFYQFTPAEKIAAWIESLNDASITDIKLPARNRLYYADKTTQIQKIRPFVYNVKTEG